MACPAVNLLLWSGKAVQTDLQAGSEGLQLRGEGLGPAAIEGQSRGGINDCGGGRKRCPGLHPVKAEAESGQGPLLL